MSTLIAPCAGLSSRYGAGKPKYLYTSPCGKPIFFLALEPLLNLHEKVIFIILKDHDNKYNASTIIKQCFQEYGYKEPEILVLKEVLNGPAFTVNFAVEEADIKGSISIKDCDSICEADNYPIGENAVSYIDASKNDIDRLSSKSSLEVDEHNKIISIKEKVIFSRYICVGIYYFKDVNIFKKEFIKLRQLKSKKEIFISHIIESLLDISIPFFSHEVRKLIDLGTIEDYYKYLSKFQTIFCDLDGTLFKNRGKYGVQTWIDDPFPLEDNINILKKLVEEGAQLIITTSRPEEFRHLTESQLSSFGIKYQQLIMGLNHSSRILINDYAESNPYPSAKAINIARNYSLSPYIKN